MYYKVSFKKPGALFWHTIKNVIGDSSMESPGGMGLPSRVLLLADNVRIEIPLSCIIKFSKEREEGLKAQSTAMQKQQEVRRVIPGKKTKHSQRSH